MISPVRPASILILGIALFFLSLPNAQCSSFEDQKSIRRAGSRTDALLQDIRIGDLYAVVVGLSHYNNPRIPSLRFSDKDARDFAEFLKTQHRLFKNVHIELLVNDQATKAAIEKNLYYKLPRAGKNDTIVLFFSGHGADDPFLPGKFFFLTSDSDPENLHATAVNMSGLEFLKRIEAQRIVLIADACHAGGYSGDPTRKASPSVNRLMLQLSESLGKAMITSSRDDEYSLENPDFSNSVFTHFLLKALRGDADKDGNGIVTLNEAYQYIYEMVKNQTEGKQHPQLEGKVVGLFPLSVVGDLKPEAIAALIPQRPGEQKRGKANLLLRTNPAKVSVKLNSLSVGESGEDSLLIINDVEVGVPQSVNLSKSGFNDYSISLTIPTSYEGKVYKHNEIRLEPKIPTASLVLSTSPLSRVRVYVGSRDCGVSGDDKYLTIPDLPVDQPLNVRMEKEGFEPRRLSITIPKGQEGKIYRYTRFSDPPLERQPEHRDTKLLNAAKSGNLKLVKQLVEEGADIKAVGGTYGYDTPIRLAAANGHAETVQFLLSKLGEEAIPDAFGRACAAGQLELVKLLLPKGINLNKRDIGEYRYADYAACSGHAEVVKYLVNNGLDINSKDSLGNSIFTWAARGGSVELMEFLLRNEVGFKINQDEYNRALDWAAGMNKLEAVKYLVRKGALVNRPKNSSTPLMSAAAGNFYGKPSPDICGFLLSKRAEINATDQFGRTALDLAVGCNKPSIEVVKLLLNRGALVNAKDNDKLTPLMRACANSSPNIHQIAEILLAKGADVNARDTQDRTPLRWANVNKNNELINLLRKHGARE